MELIETKNGRLFWSATKAGKLGKQPIGVNSMAAIPRFRATFLELPNIDEFSGHPFRRTSATLLSEKGIEATWSLEKYGCLRVNILTTPS